MRTEMDNKGFEVSGEVLEKHCVDNISTSADCIQGQAAVLAEADIRHTDKVRVVKKSKKHLCIRFSTVL